MKKHMIIFVFAICLTALYCGGCLNKDTEDVEEESKNMEFDYVKSFDTIKKSVDCDDKEIKYILDKFERFGVKGAINAKILEIKKNKEKILEIESENHKIYRVYLEEDFLVYGIQDMESEKYIYMVTK